MGQKHIKCCFMQVMARSWLVLRARRNAAAAEKSWLQKISEVRSSWYGIEWLIQKEYNNAEDICPAGFQDNRALIRFSDLLLFESFLFTLLEYLIVERRSRSDKELIGALTFCER